MQLHERRQLGADRARRQPGQRLHAASHVSVLPLHVVPCPGHVCRARRPLPNPHSCGRGIRASSALHAFGAGEVYSRSLRLEARADRHHPADSSPLWYGQVHQRSPPRLRPELACHLAGGDLHGPLRVPRVVERDERLQARASGAVRHRVPLAGVQVPRDALPLHPAAARVHLYPLHQAGAQGCRGAHSCPPSPHPPPHPTLTPPRSHITPHASFSRPYLLSRARLRSWKY